LLSIELALFLKEEKEEEQDHVVQQKVEIGT